MGEVWKECIKLMNDTSVESCLNKINNNPHLCILLFLLKDKQISYKKEIIDELGLSSSTISNYLEWLIKCNIVISDVFSFNACTIPENLRKIAEEKINKFTKGVNSAIKRNLVKKTTFYYLSKLGLTQVMSKIKSEEILKKFAEELKNKLKNKGGD